MVIVESGWGSILPTVILANMMNGGPAARSGKLSIGDQIMSINNTSLVGLPLATCQGIIKVFLHQPFHRGGGVGVSDPIRRGIAPKMNVCEPMCVFLCGRA